MLLTKFGFLFTGPNLNADVDRAEIRRDGFSCHIVGMSDPASGPDVAAELVEDGVELIELCGGFGPQWTARVIERLGHRVPVGSVGYGPESIAGMARLFPDATYEKREGGGGD